jgi:hypothetical protein
MFLFSFVLLSLEEESLFDGYSAESRTEDRDGDDNPGEPLWSAVTGESLHLPVICIRIRLSLR